MSSERLLLLYARIDMLIAFVLLLLNGALLGLLLYHDISTYTAEFGGGLWYLALMGSFPIPGMLCAVLCMAAAYGLRRKRKWAYRLHRVLLVALAFSMLLLPYALIGLVHSRRPDFKAAFGIGGGTPG